MAIKISRSKILFSLILAMALWLGCGDNDKKAVNPGNHPPVIDSVIADPDTFVSNSLTTITVTAHDPDDDALSYTWDTRGSWILPVTGAGNILQVTNCCPITEVTSGYVIAIVTDANSTSSRDSVCIWVTPTGK